MGIFRYASYVSLTGEVHLPDRRWPSSWSEIQRTEVLSEGGEFGSQKCQDLE